MSATTDLGKVSVTPQGAWSSSTAYAILDIVTNGGGSYLAKKAVPAGTALSNTEYWLQITAKGNTGNGISSIAKTSTSGLVDTYTITFTDGNTTTFTVTNGANGNITSVTGGTGISATTNNGAVTVALTEAMQEEIEGKADIDGYYETLSVGLSDNLIDRKGTGEEESFTFRTSGARGSITDDGNGIVQSVHGNTIVWNQVNDNSVTTQTVSGVTFTNNGDGSWTVNGTAEANITQNVGSGSFVASHKYLICGCPSGGSDSTYMVYTRKETLGLDTGSGIICTIDNNARKLAIRILSGVTISNLVFKPMAFDLTAMFGSGNEPTTVAEFKAMFPLDYYAYNAGSLLSYNGTGIKTVGFNQWDEEWELGGINASTGQDTSSSTTIRSKNYIRVLPGTAYCGTITSRSTNIYFYVFYYDINKNYISTQTRISDDSHSVFTTPSNAYYLRFYVAPAYGVTYNNDITINLSWSGYRNGEYEEHWDNTLALPVSTYFPSGMRSAGSVYDELTKNKAITRIGAVDLGTLDWQRAQLTSTLTYYFMATISDIKVASLNCLMTKYTRCSTTGIVEAPDKYYSISGSSSKVFIRDDSYTDAAAFKTAMSGVYLFYELATATEQTISPALDLSYPVSDFGTEQNLPENDDEPTTTPFDGIIKYSNDFTREVANLPKNYDSTDGLDALCTSLATALGTALGGTFAITRGAYDATNKKYAFTCSYTAST